MNDQFVVTDAMPPMEMSVTKTYSLTNKHIGYVAGMAEEASERTGRVVSQGEIVRSAIELLYEHFDEVFGTVTITEAGLKALSDEEK